MPFATTYTSLQVLIIQALQYRHVSRTRCALLLLFCENLGPQALDLSTVSLEGYSGLQP